MHRVCKALISAAIALVPIPALATGILPLSGSQQFDVATSPPAYLNGGQLFVYQPGTLTCASAYQDFALTIPHACPIILNAAGRIPAVYAADGQVRLRLLNATGVLQYDEDNVSVVTAGVSSGGGPLVDSTQIFGTLDLKVRFDNQPIPGYVRLNGRTIGSAVSGATERANADTQALFTQLWGFSNIAVSGGKGGSAAADWAANKQLVLPNGAGRLLGGVDDMGAGAQGVLTTSCTGPTVVGSLCGAEFRTLVGANLPAVTFPDTLGWAQDTGTSNWSGVDPSITTGFTIAAPGGSALTPASAKTQTITVTGHKTGSVTSGGSSTPMSVTSPAMLFTLYIKL